MIIETAELDQTAAMCWHIKQIIEGIELNPILLCFRVKFVGLFVILLAGYSTLTDLWRLLGDQALSLVC